MSGGPDNQRKFGLALLLGQTGMEMVAPIGLGVVLDRWLGCLPWLTITGAVLGFVGGLGHMVFLANRINKDDAPPPPGQRGGA
jgi:F0F1-type ATP synthase assembly protein I